MDIRLKLVSFCTGIGSSVMGVDAGRDLGWKLGERGCVVAHWLKKVRSPPRLARPAALGSTDLGTGDAKRTLTRAMRAATALTASRNND
jgi:hypothetical protein